jgi:acyl carrier protein
MTDERILDILAESTGLHRDKLKAEEPFDKLGMDSLDFMLFIDDVEDATKTKIPLCILDRFRTPADIAGWYSLGGM